MVYTLLLNALALIGLALFMRAWFGGVRFGERVQARLDAEEEQRKARRVGF